MSEDRQKRIKTLMDMLRDNKDQILKREPTTDRRERLPPDDNEGPIGLPYCPYDGGTCIKRQRCVRTSDQDGTENVWFCPRMKD